MDPSWLNPDLTYRATSGIVAGFPCPVCGSDKSTSPNRLLAVIVDEFGATVGQHLRCGACAFEWDELALREGS